MLNQRKRGRIAFKPMTFGLCHLVLLLITMEQNRERKVKGYVKVYTLIILKLFTGLF